MMYRDNGRSQGGSKVCSFFLNGRCKFGDNCKFDHPGASRQQEPSNRFAALGGQQGNAFGGRGRSPQPGNNQPLPYHLSRENIITDLKNERPIWPFSAYGPGRDAPRQLLEGFPLEQSPEEMRVMYYLAQASGNPQPAIQSEQELLQKTNQQVQQVLNDIDGAIQYVLAGDNEHPNRRDKCQAPAGNSQPNPNPFSGAQTSTSSFGKPSAMGAGLNTQPAFGAPSFGKASSPFAVAAQPSAFGKPSTGSTFGQPSASGQGSAFGQASVPGQTSGFGQPSALGQNSAFGQASMPGQTSAFGQPSVPGQTNAFGQPSAPRPATAFGQSSTPGQTSAFGQPSQSGQANAFGQPSVPGQASAFGQPSVPGQTNAFGQPTQPGSGGAFGQPSALGQSNPASAFGQKSNPAQQPSPFAQGGSATAFGQSNQPRQASPFAQPASGQNTGAFGSTSAFGQPSSLGSGQTTGAFGQPSSNGQSTPQQPNSNPFASKAVDTQAATNPFGRPPPTDSGAFGHPSTTSASGQPSRIDPAQISANAAARSAAIYGGQSNSMTNGAGATPDPSTYIVKNPNNQIRSFKGQQVTWIDQEPYYRRQDDRTEERIWFPDGPPGANKYSEESPELYNALNPALEEAYRHLAQTGMFKDGIMPEFAPKREWVRFDL